MTAASVVLPFSVSVQFAGYGISTPTQAPNTLHCLQREYSHDTLVMEFWGGDVNAEALTSGMPVYATFGNATGQRAFYGYVNHPVRTNNALANTSLTQRNAVTVTCAGASWPMKAVGNQVFTSMTTSQIVANIAGQFNLATNIVPDTTVWPSKAMAGLSYWQFCVSLAEQIGYTFYCNGIQIVFAPRQTNPLALSGVAATYDYKSNPSGFPIFTPMLGSNSPNGGQLLNRVLAGINPRTNQPIFTQQAGSPSPTVLGVAAELPPFNQIEHYTVNSQQESNTKLNGAGALNQMYITAQATAVGNPRVCQGSMILVENANGSQNGLWFVTGVKHSINTQNYSMDLELGRDSLGATQSIAVSSVPQSIPVATLVNGSWGVA